MQSWHEGLPTDTPNLLKLPLPKRRRVRGPAEEAGRALADPTSDGSAFGRSDENDVQILA